MLLGYFSSHVHVITSYIPIHSVLNRAYMVVTNKWTRFFVVVKCHHIFSDTDEADTERNTIMRVTRFRVKEPWEYFNGAKEK